jgi:hypothetical protein
MSSVGFQVLYIALECPAVLSYLFNMTDDVFFVPLSSTKYLFENNFNFLLTLSCIVQDTSKTVGS